MSKGYAYRVAGIAAMVFLLGGAIAVGETHLADPVYDFGVISEEAGSVTGTAHVVNTGTDTTYVRDVRPSCGCTGARYSTEPLAPGDTAVVSFTYNPVGRPGTIGKTVKIYMGDDGERHIVRLTGRVVGSAKTLQRNYPVECGAIRLSDSIVDMANVRENSGRHAFLRIINGTLDTVTPQMLNENRALSVDITPARLLPGDVGTLGIYLNTKFTDTTGNVAYRVPVWTAGNDSARVTVTVKANIYAEPADSVTARAAVRHEGARQS